MGTTHNERISRSRSRSIIIATFLQLIQGVVLLFYGIIQIYNHGWAIQQAVGGWRYIPFPLFESLSSGVILTLLGIFTMIVAIAFWFLMDWAWVSAMTMQGLGLVVGLANYLRDQPNYIGMLLGMIIIFYLNHIDVQGTFRQRKSQ